MSTRKQRGSRQTRKPTKSPCDNAAFLAAMDEDIADRVKQMAAWKEQQVAVQRVNDLARSIQDRLRLLADSGPRPPYRPEDPPPPFHIRMWADRIVSLARDWNEYHALMGERALPVVSDDYGHDAARRLFACACETQDTTTVASQLEQMLARLHKFGKTVFTRSESFHEGTFGLGDYFNIVALGFGNSGGQIWKYNGRPVPGRILIGADGQRVVTGKPRRSERAPSPEAEPEQPEEPPAAPSPNTTAPIPRRGKQARVPAIFRQRILAAMPIDGSWIHGADLLEAADYNPGGGRYWQHLGILSHEDGPLESLKGKGDSKGYRLRRPS